MLKLVFLISRTNNYRWFAPVINTALERGHTVELWHDYSEGPKSQSKSGPKGYLFPYIYSSPFWPPKIFNVVIKAIHRRNRFRELILNCKDVDYFIGLSPLNDAFFDVDDTILRLLDGKWVMIGHGGDSIIELTLDNPCLTHNYHRIIFFDTETNLQIGIRGIEAKWPASVDFINSKLSELHFVGSAMMQPQFRLLDKRKLRSKYGIPDGVSPIVYLPFPFSTNRKYRCFPAKGILRTGWALQSAWSGIFLSGENTFGQSWETRLRSRGLLTLSWKLLCLFKILSNFTALSWFVRGLSEPSLARKLRTFCDQQNLFLIVKPRRKFPYPTTLEKIADLVIDDDEQQVYPTKMQELLCISNLAVGGLSSTVLEAVFAGVPYLNIGIPQYDLPTDEEWVYDYEPGSMYNFPGVVTNLSVSELHHFTWPNSLLRIDPAAQQAYLKQYVGPPFQNPSEHILEILEGRQRYPAGSIAD